MTRSALRALVIDNYDSFTYNLVQYLADLTGADPKVVRNNDDTWHRQDLAGFDCVVISPGPGRPDRPADFGICAGVIAEAGMPLLGVCLGHQGICHSFGGTVTSAPEPMHGRTSPVTHSGDELFAGIPSPFRAVRYHSLMIGEVPEVLEVIAAADDGVPMALRHRSRPLWGVQFHPESIGTEYGYRMLGNFVGLAEAARTGASRRRPARTAAPGRPARTAASERPARTAASERPARTAAPGRPTRTAAPGRPARPSATAAPARLRVLARRVACHATAESVSDAIYRDHEHSFWLDSGQRQGDAGRFSFLGDASGPLARTVSADVGSGVVRIASRTGHESASGSFFEWIRADLLAHRADIPPLPFDFALG